MREDDETTHDDPGNLSPTRAFVVQLRGRPGAFAGRVEHIASGEAARFESGDELLAFLRRETSSRRDQRDPS
jgi:hypothetical protein